MATYVPGSKTYGREFEAFTPDYKFLSSVLDVRQDRYDTNYKQLSDLYSRVVYADLSRQDTQTIRDQYASQLTPKIEQLSGMDLSLRQNVDAAKGLFKPFYEDDLIVKDLVMTSQYKKNLSLADTYRNSAAADQRTKYWSEGVKAMQYQMEDFVAAERNEALNAALPRYVENVDLAKMAEDILKESGLSVEIPDAATFDKPFIITNKNGEQVTPHAYSLLRRRLLEDPKVIDAYRVSGMVRSRDYAKEGLDAGRFSTVKEGQIEWAKETLSTLRENNQNAHPILKAQFDQALSAKNNWERYEKEQGILPDSPEKQRMMEVFSEFEAARNSLEDNEKNINRLDNVQEGDDLLNLAYNMLMNYNLSSDMLAAAQTYSRRDMKVSYEVNPYIKMKQEFEYDVQLENIKNANARDLAILKAELDRKNKNLGVDGLANKFMDLFGSPLLPDAHSSTWEDETPIITRNAETVSNFIASTDAERANFITQIHRLNESTKPVGQSSPNQMTVQLDDGSTFTGDLDKVKQELLRRDESGNYVNGKALDAAYQNAVNIYDKAEQDNPLLYRSQEYTQLQDVYEEINARKDKLLEWRRVEGQVLAESAEKLRSLANTEIKGFSDNDVPLIVESDKDRAIETIRKEADVTIDQAQGAYANANRGGSDLTNGKLLTEDEYIEKFVEAAQNRVMKNTDGFYEGRGLRTDNGFMLPSLANPAGQYLMHGIKRLYDAATGDIVFDREEAVNEARDVYQKQLEILNQAMDGSINASVFEGQREFQPLSADAYFRNVPLEEMTASDVQTYYGYQETFQINNLAQNPEARDMFANLYRQYSQTEESQRFIMPTAQGQAPSLEKDSVADYIFAQTLRDAQGAILNPDAAASKDFQFNIEYRPIAYRDSEGKTYAGYVIKNGHDYLENFAGTKPRQGNISGQIEKADIPKYSEITMLVDTEADINPRRVGEYNFSSVDTRIGISEDNSYNFTTYANAAGSFKIFKENGVYYSSIEMRTVDPKTGLFKDNGRETQMITYPGTNQPVGRNDIDRFAAHYRDGLRQTYIQNLAEEARIKQQLGIE